MRRGEVWWYEPPDAKRRPVLILTRDSEAIGRVRDMIAVPVTGTIRNLDTEIEIGVTDGMPVECVLAVDNTLSAEKAFLTKKIATLPGGEAGRSLHNAGRRDKLRLTKKQSSGGARRVQESPGVPRGGATSGIWRSLLKNITSLPSTLAGRIAKP